MTELRMNPKMCTRMWPQDAGGPLQLNTDRRRVNGPLGQDATVFFNELGRRIEATTAEPRSLQFLFQRLSVTVQRGNAACVI